MLATAWDINYSLDVELTASKADAIRPFNAERPPDVNHGDGLSNNEVVMDPSNRLDDNDGDDNDIIGKVGNVSQVFISVAPDERDDPVVMDGDILLSKEQAAIFYKSGWDGLVKSQAWARRRRWGRTIRYKWSRKISEKHLSAKLYCLSIGGSVRTNLFASLNEIQRRTCVVFRQVRRRYRRPHLLFKRGRG